VNNSILSRWRETFRRKSCAQEIQSGVKQTPANVSPPAVSRLLEFLHSFSFKCLLKDRDKANVHLDDEIPAIV